MKRSRFANVPSAIATGALLLLAACSASPTPFQKAGDDGGYTDQQLANGSYQATFTGNAATPRPSVQKAVLFRAAQVTLQADHSHFKVLSNTVEPVSQPSEGDRFSVLGLFGKRSGGGLVSKLDFTLVEGEPVAEDPNVYNASKLIREFGDSVLSPKSGATGVRDGAIINDLRAPRSRDF